LIRAFRWLRRTAGLALAFEASSCRSMTLCGRNGDRRTDGLRKSSIAMVDERMVDDPGPP
jgi:hypothetical protein